MIIYMIKYYPDINIGFGSGYPINRFKITWKAFFHPWWWRDTKYEFKYAWQRVTRGYDDQATWDVTEYIKKLLVHLLVDLAEKHRGVPAFDGYNFHDYHEMPKEEAEHKLREQDVIWTQILRDLADDFYESLKWVDSQYETNQYEEEYHNSFDAKFFPSETKGYSELVFIPNEGYTQEQVDLIRDKFHKREEEIDAYKLEKLILALEGFKKYASFLWD